MLFISTEIFEKTGKVSERINILFCKFSL